MKNYTDINILVDRSGSMQPIAKDMIGGLTTFIQTQRELKQEANISYYLFDDQYEVVFENKPLAEVKDSDVTLVPRGWTALVDSLGKTINAVGERLSKLSEEEKPNRVLIVTITDGADNRSREFTNSQLKEMVHHQRDVYAWDFVFLGANIDSFSTGGSIGIYKGSTCNYTADSAGVTTAFESLNRNSRAYATLDRTKDRRSTFEFTELSK